MKAIKFLLLILLTSLSTETFAQKSKYNNYESY